MKLLSVLVPISRCHKSALAACSLLSREVLQEGEHLGGSPEGTFGGEICGLFHVWYQEDLEEQEEPTEAGTQVPGV